MMKARLTVCHKFQAGIRDLMVTLCCRPRPGSGPVMDHLPLERLAGHGEAFDPGPVDVTTPARRRWMYRGKDY
jgi:hypothetical protein